LNCLSRWAFVFLSLTLSQFAIGLTPAEQAALVNATSAQAKTLGGAKKQSTFDGIQSGASNAGIPKYGQSPSETSFYANGNGDTFGPGNTKVSNCASQPPNADPVLAQECEAVNFASTNPSRRPPVTIKKTDPLISSYKSFKGAVDSNATAAPLTPATSDNKGNCTQTTETIPPVFAEKTCTTITGIDLAQQCVMGRAIDITSQANFQCNQTKNAYENISCRRGNSVSVGFGQCTPNSWLGRVAYMDCSYCYDPYMAMNIYCGADGFSYDIEPYRSYDGVNAYDYNQIGIAWNGIYPKFPVNVAPGQSIVDKYVGDIGQGCSFKMYFSSSCNSTTCIPSITTVNAGCNASSGSASGAALLLPIKKTVSTWTTNGCLTLQQRAL